MRVLSLAGKFALVSIAMAKTSYVTRYHYVTVDSNGNIVDTNTVLSPASEVTELLQPPPVPLLAPIVTFLGRQLPCQL